MLKQQNEQEAIYDRVRGFSKSNKLTFYVEISKKWPFRTELPLLLSCLVDLTNDLIEYFFWFIQFMLIHFKFDSDENNIKAKN